jgi:mRNA interferase YafQ
MPTSFLQTLKKTSASKRASLPRAANYAKSFLKDWERILRAGRHDMNRLKEAMLLLIANEGPLGPEWLDHPLKGEWAGNRECHIGGDFLLIYRLQDNGKTDLIIFVAAGTHSDLFDE